MKPIAISLALAMAGIAAPAMAQSSGSNAPNAPAAAGTQATPAEVSPEQLAAAMELLDANGSIANLGTMLDSLAPLEAEQIKHLDPNIDIATSAAVLTAVRNEIISRKDEYKRLIAGVYARHFSIDEMQKLTAFYRSEAGQKYIETMPSLIKELTPVGAAWAAGVTMDAVRKVLKAADNSRQHA